LLKEGSGRFPHRVQMSGICIEELAGWKVSPSKVGTKALVGFRAIHRHSWIPIRESESFRTRQSKIPWP